MRLGGEYPAQLTRIVTSLHFSSVVLHELLVGATNKEKERQIRRTFAEPFLRRGRVVTPSHTCWEATGEALARLAAAGELDRTAVPRSLVNDALLAASCREAGVTLVTENVRDFEKLRRFLHFDFVPPWPEIGPDSRER